MKLLAASTAFRLSAQSVWILRAWNDSDTAETPCRVYIVEWEAFVRENFHKYYWWKICGLLACAVQRDTTPPNKILQLATKFAKFTKVFSLTSFPLYGIHLDMLGSTEWLFIHSIGSWHHDQSALNVCSMQREDYSWLFRHATTHGKQKEG